MAVNSPITQHEEKSAPRRWRLLALSAALVLIAFVAHAPLLRWTYAGLVYEEADRPTDLTVILFGDKASSDMACMRMKTSMTERVLILQGRIPRTVELGLAPELGDVARRELVTQGIDAQRISVCTTHAPTLPAMLRSLEEQLAGETPGSVSLLCPRDRTAWLKQVLDDVLPVPVRKRWHICPVAIYGYHADRWWLDRTGWKRVSSAWLRQWHWTLFGEPPAAAAWDPDQYAQLLASPE
jgi:hypothetical protein